MLKKLRVKFIAVIMLIVTVMLAVIFGLIFHFTHQALEAESIQMMERIASEPIHLGLPGEPPGGVQLPYFTVETGMQGEIVTGGGYYDLSDKEFIAAVTEAAVKNGEKTGILEEYSLRFYRGGPHTRERIVFADITSERITLSNLVRDCAFIGIVSLLLFFGISLLLARWAVKPVDAAWQQQRRFVADASHELKTPLTIIMTNAELLESRMEDNPDAAGCAAAIKSTSKRMKGLVENLLDLARVDSGAAASSMNTVDFSAVVADALLPFEPLFFEKGLELSSEVQPGISVNGSENHLRQLSEILLENAMKYSPVPSTVKLSLKKHGSHCLLKISNPGPQLTQQELKNLFKRFYRLDKSRSMSGSYGLGLAIAESVTLSHKGRIWAECSGGEICFKVLLPMKN